MPRTEGEPMSTLFNLTRFTAALILFAALVNELATRLQRR
jgi:hypothetical protein